MLPGFLATAGAGVTCWGVDGPPSDTVVLSPVVRTADGALDPGAVAEELATRPGALARLLPPFAAVRQDHSGVTMVADSMGFRQLFHTSPGESGDAMLSSSALAIARKQGARLDLAAVGNQSLLGWQLGQRTLFEGVDKLAPGVVAKLSSGGLSLSEAPEQEGGPLALEKAVAGAAALLRTALASLLDDHPDAVLQLTGGADSRLLLSAIHPARRRGLRAMTLHVPGGSDAAIARDISARYGIDHEVKDLASLDDVTGEDAWRLCTDAAVRLDAMSDPVGLAALGVGERSFAQGVRISGLGGEVARGFYYVGRVDDRPYTPKDAARLAAWRMFVNEAVEPGLLTDEFTRSARETAEREVYEALRAGGEEWFRATDELYLRHRMQRWAGATDTAVSGQRTVINPMLDPAFLEISRRLRPQDKADSRFLASLQMALDPDLGRIPLDGRPAPSAYAAHSSWWSIVHTVSTGRRLARKAVQRLRHGNRAPAGGAVLAEKVVQHWRANPAIVAPLASLDFVRPEWVVAMLESNVEPRPSSVAFVTNLIVATRGQ